jgi:hypothetical protein
MSIFTSPWAKTAPDKNTQTTKLLKIHIPKPSYQPR